MAGPQKTDEQISRLLHAVGKEESRLVAQALKNPTPAKIVDLADKTRALLLQAMRSLTPARTGMAGCLECRPGCSYCCRVRVKVRPPEVIGIVRHVRARMKPDDLAAVKARISALDDQVRGLGDASRIRLRKPCALLVNDRCAIYTQRPIACIAMASFSAEGCREDLYSYDEVPVPLYAPYFAAAGFIEMAQADGLKKAGLYAEGLELTTALRIGLETANVAGRWLAGEPVLVPAQLEEGD